MKEPKFKIGDRVKRINSSFHMMHINDIGIIESCSNTTCDVGLYDGYLSKGHDPGNLELVEESQNINNLNPYII